MSDEYVGVCGETERFLKKRVSDCTIPTLDYIPPPKNTYKQEASELYGLLILYLKSGTVREGIGRLQQNPWKHVFACRTYTADVLSKNN